MNLFRRCWYRFQLSRHGLTDYDAQRIASKEWLNSSEWRRARYDALANNDGRCELCGRNKHQLEPGEFLNVDHIYCRRLYPWLALKVKWLQVLCGPCNQGRGNRSTRDWRHPHHPHREGQ